MACQLALDLGYPCQFYCVAWTAHEERRLLAWRASGVRLDIFASDGNAVLYLRTCGAPCAEEMHVARLGLYLVRVSCKPRAKGSALSCPRRFSQAYFAMHEGQVKARRRLVCRIMQQKCACKTHKKAVGILAEMADAERQLRGTLRHDICLVRMFARTHWLPRLLLRNRSPTQPRAHLIVCQGGRLS